MISDVSAYVLVKLSELLVEIIRLGERRGETLREAVCDVAANVLRYLCSLAFKRIRLRGGADGLAW